MPNDSIISSELGIWHWIGAIGGLIVSVVGFRHGVVIVLNEREKNIVKSKLRHSPNKLKLAIKENLGENYFLFCGAFVYRLGREVLNLERGVQLPYALPNFLQIIHHLAANDNVREIGRCVRSPRQGHPHWAERPSENGRAASS